MMKVQYTLDDEDGIDPEDPLGNLVLSDNEGRLLTIKETFIDVWLLSFLNALMKISSGASLQINVLEETDQVIVTEIDGILTFNYEDESISAETSEAVEAFKNTARKLVDELSHHKGVEKNISVSALKALIVD